MIQVRVGNSQAGFSAEFLGLCAMAIVKESCGPYFAVQEKGKLNEGLHIHVLIMLDGKIQAFRKRLLRSVPGLKGRGNYSIIPNVEDTPVLPGVQEIWKTYLCKGERVSVYPIVLYNTMLTQENIIERHYKYWELYGPKKQERDALEFVDIVGSSSDDVVAIDIPNKKRRQRTFVEKVADELSDNNEGKHWSMCAEDRRIVFRTVMRNLGRLGKVLDSTIVKRICYGVHNVLSPDEMCDEIWFQIYGESFSMTP